VVEYCCGLSSVTFNFGDAIWMSPPKGYGYAIKATHTYSRPGSYMITGRAISTAWCDYEVREMSWIVNVGTTPLKVSAVKLPGGPPYRVYLTTTDEIRLDCPLSTIVQWEQYYGSPQPTTWYLENGVYRTPTHDYSSKATRTITVANSYGPDCAVDQAGSVTVNVNGLATTGDATRVATTWGAIKAMYR
jgi:hypothetical protein